MTVESPHGVVGSPCGIVANVLDCDIVISEFQLHLCNYIHFQTDSLNPKKKGKIVPLLSFEKDGFGIK